MRIVRDDHAPDLTLGEVGDLLFTAIEVFVGHAFERPMDLRELSRNLEMPRDTVRRKLQRLIEIVTEGGQAVVAGDKVTSRTRGRRRSGGGRMVKNEQ